jgi:hypothetical protein
VLRKRLARAAAGGPSSAVFALGPGYFRAKLVATDAAGNRAALRPLRFRVVKR